ncbi:GrpB family protein [Nonomuraea sp. NPDC049480]|uniref:GrpB family protein n=1 Tax=Nonomuraea sp. NPDC049480 TaxID=3364353 RepID=UPI003793358F
MHCYPPDHVDVRRYLAFRDRLRASESDRDLYAATKRELAQREWRDINYYAEAKGPVIGQILTRAGWRN